MPFPMCAWNTITEPILVGPSCYGAGGGRFIRVDGNAAHGPGRVWCVAGSGPGLRRLPGRADGFRLVVDLGYATVPRLLERAAPGQVDAVFISHGHPDHCADLNPLLRARVLREDPAAALPVYALPGALEICLLDGGHFLLESHLDTAAGIIRGFLERTLS